MLPRRLLLSAALVLGCRPGAAPPEPAPATQPAPALRWAACTPSAEPAECATIEVPLDYGDPDGEQIEVAMMRIRSPEPTGTQLWYLAGGPGGSGTSLLPLLYARFGEALPGVDFYAIDHRGTGGTMRLSCPAQEEAGSIGDRLLAPSELPACAEHLTDIHGERLAHVTTANAASDLARAIEASRGEDRVLLWGNSYGTHWADHLMRSFPDLSDGVFLEALVPGDFSYRGFDHWMNDAGQRLMQRCADDPACRERFGSDPMQAVRTLPSRLRDGHCAALELPVPVSWVLGSMLYDHDLRDMVPLLVRMVDRCSDRDVARLQRMYVGLFADNGSLTAGDFAMATYVHVALSALWSDGLPDDAEIEAVSETCLFCPSDRAPLDAARTRWPTYEAPAVPEIRYEGPLWMLQGGLDPGVSPEVASGMGGDYDGEHQHFIDIPGGAHTLVGKTPAPVGDCALTLLREFVHDPKATPTSCADDVAGPSFVLEPTPLTEALLGGGDPWATAP